MHRSIDPQIEKDITALMTCAPIGCSRECSCFRVARFARDRIRELHTQNALAKAKEYDEDFVEQYSITRLYANVGTWESA